jgi:long-chain fatty acid transport protein
MKNVGKALLIVLGAASLVVAPNTFATNGYFSHGNGTKNKGLAGAGLAMPEEAMAIANNPASALFVDDGIEAGASFFNPNHNYSTSASLAQGNGGAFTVGPNSIDSARDWYVIPYVAMTKRLTEDSAWGWAFYGRGGMNTRWEGGTASFDPDGPGPAPVGAYPGTFGSGAFGLSGHTGIDLAQAFLDLSYARKTSDNLTVGIGLVAALQLFSAQGIDAFLPFTESFLAAGGMDPSVVTGLSGNGHDNSIGFGIKVGMNAALSDRVSFAGMYQTKMDMSEFDDYSDLFAEKGDFDIPANLKLGLTYKPTDRVALSLDVDHTWFSDVNSVGNGIENLFTCPSVNPASTTLSGCLGGANGGGFGWDDMTVVKLGVQWSNNDVMTWRAGFSHGSQPIPESQVLFNILAPAVIDDHLSIGFTRKHGLNNEINVAFTHALNNSVSGPNTFDPTQTIILEMNQNELEVGYTWKF